MNLKKYKRQLAERRISDLLRNALNSAQDDYRFANIQANRARDFAKKFNIKLRFPDRILFCHNCKRFIVPGFNSRIRLSKIRKSMNITCLFCGFTYRKMIYNSQT